jgi:pseudaminic acid biosynthesis-associated methylase
MPRDRSPQESFWAGEFGNDYVGRNDDKNIVAGNIHLFASALKGIRIKSVLEVGPNIGMNLAALRFLYPQIGLSAIEINETAANELSLRLPDAYVEVASILESEINNKYDLVLSKGVLIHLDPGLLPDVYRKIRSWASRYILFAEYYNPTPLAIPYRGHDDRLFKRDFAGEFLAAYPDFALKNYGFVYRNDPAHPLDDITWFLMERSNL